MLFAVNGLDITYEIDVNLAHYGILTDEVIAEIEATKILPTEPFYYKFRAAKPRVNQPGGTEEMRDLWQTSDYELYRVVSDRNVRNDQKDHAFLKLIFETRWLVFEFARKKNLPMKHFSLKASENTNREQWSFRQMLLTFFDMYRSHVCQPKGVRAKLYGKLSWKTVTLTILANFKCILRNHEFFGTKTEDILRYTFSSPLAKKVMKGK